MGTPFFPCHQVLFHVCRQYKRPALVLWGGQQVLFTALTSHLFEHLLARGGTYCLPLLFLNDSILVKIILRQIPLWLQFPLLDEIFDLASNGFIRRAVLESAELTEGI